MRLPRRGPDRANKVAREIPMRRIPWDTAEPGHFEVDLVHHSGPRSDGEFVHTFQMIDVATGWSERVAILGRSQRAMEEGTRLILARLPFPVKELHPDNGPEFLNHHLVRIWGEAITGLDPDALAAVPEERQPLRRAEERHPGPGLPRAGPARHGRAVRRAERAL